MHSGKFVFAQIVEFINKYEFDKCVKRYNGDFRTRELNLFLISFVTIYNKSDSPARFILNPPFGLQFCQRLID